MWSFELDIFAEVNPVIINLLKQKLPADYKVGNSVRKSGASDLRPLYALK